MPGARSSSTSSSSAGCSGPGSWSWSASGPFSRTPLGWSRSANISAEWGTGSPSGRSRPQTTYLAQVRTRGILTATRADHWEQAMGPLRALFLGSPPPRHATVGSVRVLGPHPPQGSPLYLTADQVRRYSPGKYLRGSWPWEGYTRMLSEDSVLPTILRSYGWAAETFATSCKGWHGFFADSPNGPRFLSPRAVSYTHLTLPTN